VFVTGTDTGVGKTVIAAGLAAWARSRGCDVGVMKPVASGARRGRGGRLVSDDAAQLARAAGVTDALELVGPVCYQEPLAPYTAALRAHRRLSWSRITSAYARLSARHAFLIVEGIGGLLVPLSARRTVVDLIKALALPCVVVGRLRLGTLNHTLLTVRAALGEGLDVLGVILNESVPPARDRAGQLAERTNPAMLQRLLPVPVLGTLPYREALARPQVSGAALAAWVADAVDPRLFEWIIPQPPCQPTAGPRQPGAGSGGGVVLASACGRPTEVVGSLTGVRGCDSLGR